MKQESKFDLLSIEGIEMDGCVYLVQVIGTYFYHLDRTTDPMKDTQKLIDHYREVHNLEIKIKCIVGFHNSEQAIKEIREWYARHRFTSIDDDLFRLTPALAQFIETQIRALGDNPYFFMEL